MRSYICELPIATSTVYLPGDEGGKKQQVVVVFDDVFLLLFPSFSCFISSSSSLQTDSFTFIPLAQQERKAVHSR